MKSFDDLACPRALYTLDHLSTEPQGRTFSYVTSLDAEPGYGVNTYKLVNKAGKETLVKFHWYPDGGAEFMTDEQAATVGEKNMRHRHAHLGCSK